MARESQDQPPLISGISLTDMGDADHLHQRALLSISTSDGDFDLVLEDVDAARFLYDLKDFVGEDIKKRPR